jgi:bacillithiol system protein YtxJ
MNWNTIDNVSQIDLLKKESEQQTVLIFKHSTSCSISRTVLDRLERHWKAEDAPQAKPYFLDLLSHRDVSKQLVDVFGVQHESPQALIIKNGKVVYHNSHFGIEYAQLKEILKN